MLTTNLVVGETWTFLRRRDSHRSAVGFLDAVEGLVAGAKLIVHHVDEAQEEAARRWLRRHDERAYSFVDAAGFQVMRDRRLREALAFDGDFSAAGFVPVLGFFFGFVMNAVGWGVAIRTKFGSRENWFVKTPPAC